jgi:hypothetical protein
MENFRKCSQLVLDTSCCISWFALLGAASTGLLSMYPPWLRLGDFQSSDLVGTSVFQVAEIRGCPHQLTLS